MSSELLEQLSLDENTRYRDLVYKAVVDNCELNGASRQRIEKYVQQTESCQDRDVNTEHVKLALRNALKSGAVVRIKGYGLNGSFAPASRTDLSDIHYSGSASRDLHLPNKVNSREVAEDSEQTTTAVGKSAKNLQETYFQDSSRTQIITGASLKTILKTPKRRFRVRKIMKNFDSFHPYSVRKVKFARSPKVLFISPKKDPRRSTRLLGNCVERKA